MIKDELIYFSDFIVQCKTLNEFENKITDLQPELELSNNQLHTNTTATDDAL